MGKILHIASLLSKDSDEKTKQAKSFAEENKDVIQQEIQSLGENDTSISAIVNSLFPASVPVDENFYSRISNINYCLGWTSNASNAIGLIWALAHKRLIPPEDSILLNHLPSSNSNIFHVLRALPTFLRKVDLNSKFAGEWFLSLCSRVSGDLAGGPFFEAMHEFGFNHPKSSLEVLEQYLKLELEGFRANIFPFLLGGVRAWGKKGKVKDPTLKKIERRLKSHPKQLYRRCFNHSWVGLYSEETISFQSLCVQLDKLLEWTNDDKEDALWVLSRCLLRKLDQPGILKKGVQWIKVTLTHQPHPQSKWALLGLIGPLYQSAKSVASELDPTDIDSLLLAIQPTPKEEPGSWNEVEHYLVSRLKDDQDAFKEILKEISKNNPEDFPTLIKEHKLDYLISEISQHNPSALISDLILSPHGHERKLGRTLLSKIPIEKLDEEVIQQKSSNSLLRILLLEISLTHFTSEIAPRVFEAIYPMYENAENSLRSECIEEMTLQAINYPGSCLQKWKDISEPFPLLLEVIKNADQYFQRLHSADNCPGRFITSPQLPQAFKDWERRFANEIDKGAKQASIFRNLVRNYQIIYGSQWSTFNGGIISNTSNPQPISHGTEFPRLELLDPEGMAIRRLQLNSKLRKLLKSDFGNGAEDT